MGYETSKAKDISINITIPLFPQDGTDGSPRSVHAAPFNPAAAGSPLARKALEASDQLLAVLQEASRNALLTDMGTEALCEFEKFHRALKNQVEGHKD